VVASPASNPSPPGWKNGLAPLVIALAPWAVTAAVAAAWLSSQPRKLPEQTPKPPGLSEERIDTPEHFEELEPGRGRIARAPLHIPWRGWKDILWRTYREINHDRLQAVAGSITFYVLLSIFPALGVFVSVYGLMANVAAVQAQLDALALIFPSDVLRIVGDQMMRLATERGSNLSLAFFISLLISIWSANAGMKALFEGLNVAYDEIEKRNFFLRTALTYAFTLAFLAFITLVSGLMVAAPLLLKAAHLRTDWLLGARWVVLFAIVVGTFSIVYRYGPCRRRAQWRWVTWGAVVAAMIWLAGSAGFSWWVNTVFRIQATYGSLGAVIGLMLWVYFSVMVVLMGAELNAEIEHQTAQDSTVGAPKPMGERGAAMADTVGLPFIGVRKGLKMLMGDAGRQVRNLVRRPAPVDASGTRPQAPPAAPPGLPRSGD
jgi:membrane protein